MNTGFTDLLEKFLSDKLSPGEVNEFLLAVQEPDNEEVMIQLFRQKLAANNYSGYSEGMDKDILFRDMLKKAMEIETTGNAKVVRMQPKLNWKKWVIAASVITLLGFGSYFLFFDKTGKKETPIVQATKDIEAPTSAKAMITLVDGRMVSLDSVANGTLAIQGNVDIIKTADGQVIYNGSSGETAYNTLYNPRGSKVVNLTLQDGTKVWLNSESSFRYPTAFAGNERRVEITGEAYFEVSKDPTKKFLVAAGEVTTEVLGTHFNVNSYGDENDTRITLLEGSVKTTIGNGQSAILKPGQQARVTNKIKVSDVDTEEVMAWKDGFFNFDSMRVVDIMKEVGRWYDLDISYKGKQSDKHFGGIVSRSSNVSAVLAIMQQAGILFTIEGKKITVGQ